jgi:tetratricopeptide (TPR) repeat protein
MKKIKIFLSAFIIFSYFTTYICHDFCVYAKELPRLAIIDISQDTISTLNREKIERLLRDQFNLSGKFSLINKEKVNDHIKNLTQKEESFEKNEGLKEAKILLNQAKKLYENSNQFKEAILKLKEAIKLFEQNLKYIKDNTDILATYLYLAQCYLAQNNESEAFVLFETMIKYDPEIKLDPNTVPPKIIEKFKQAKKNLKIYDRTTLKITTSQPEIDIYLNGKFIGQTNQDKSLIVKNILVGKYSILASSKEYMNVFKVFVAHSGETLIDITLQERNFSRILEPYSSKSKEEFVNFLIRFGKNKEISADIILLFSVTNEINVYKINGQLFDTRTSIHTKSLKVAIGDTLKNPTEAVENLYNALANNIDQDGTILDIPMEAITPQKTESLEQGLKEEPPLPAIEEPIRRDVIRPEAEGVDIETKKAIAWTILGIIVLGGLATLAVWQIRENSGAEVTFLPP